MKIETGSSSLTIWVDDDLHLPPQGYVRISLDDLDELIGRAALNDADRNARNDGPGSERTDG